MNKMVSDRDAFTSQGPCCQNYRTLPSCVRIARADTYWALEHTCVL